MKFFLLRLLLTRFFGEFQCIFSVHCSCWIIRHKFLHPLTYFPMRWIRSLLYIYHLLFTSILVCCSYITNKCGTCTFAGHSHQMYQLSTAQICQWISMASLRPWNLFGKTIYAACLPSSDFHRFSVVHLSSKPKERFEHQTLMNFLGQHVYIDITCNVWVRMHADWRHIIHSKPVGISLFKSFLFVTTWVKQTLVWLQYAGQYTHAQQHASQTYTG